MRVLVAPASFKESLSAAEVARAMADGVRRAGAEAVELPLADGGRGTAECLAGPLGLQMRSVAVAGPLGEPVTGAFGINAETGTAVLEMASASGLALVPPPRRDVMRATTRGSGELVREALEAGARQVIIGVGDSATADGGCGAAQALGVRLLDAGGSAIGPGAGALVNLAHIDVSDRHASVAETQFRVACDVDNPLLGPRGAARVFAPQKGASPAQVETIEANLAHLADVIERDLGVDVRAVPGGGAAGGLGAGAVAFFGASLEPGAEWILSAVHAEEHLAHADLVLTGEGRLDAQSLGGKVPMVLARLARAAGAPCVVIPGSVGPGHEAALEEGASAVFPLVGGDVTLSDALARPAALLARRAEESVRRFAAGNLSAG